MTKAKTSVKTPAQPASASRAAASANWEARRNPFTKSPIPGLAPGMFVRSMMSGHGDPYEVLKVVDDQFVACRMVTAGGKQGLKAYVLSNDASYFKVCAQRA